MMVSPPIDEDPQLAGEQPLGSQTVDDSEIVDRSCFPRHKACFADSDIQSLFVASSDVSLDKQLATS